MSARDQGFLLDMLLAARAALEELGDTVEEAFFEDRLLQVFVAHQIQVIGEAATNVSAKLQAAHPDIDWAEITGMRHRIVHGYRDIDFDLVWSTARDDLPLLVKLLEPLVPPEEPE